MFRVIPHRALVEPGVSLADIKADGVRATAVLRIDGLVCSACAARVRRRLERLNGVASADVDLELGEAHVAYDAARCTTDALVGAVEGAVIARPLRRFIARHSGWTNGGRALAGAWATARERR